MIGDISHICNRGVEKKNIFLDERDYARFVDNLFLLNNKSGKMRTTKKDIFSNENVFSKQEKLVEILKWSLLPNHYHLLVYEVVEGGILEFTKRLGNAYTKYFNTKNEGRSGYVFQNRAKNVPILTQEQFLYIPFYIDLNPLDLRFPNWESSEYDHIEGINFLKSYEWSSFKDYFGNGKREKILNKNLFYELFDTDPGMYQADIVKFVTNQ